MDWLVSLPSWQVLLLSLTLTIGAAALLVVLFGRFLVGEQREKAALTAVAYMTAFGSLFAILTGFLINAEYGTLREARNSVGAEVAAASQLASASAALSAADTARLQQKLTDYLDAAARTDWEALGSSDSDSAPSTRELRLLQHEVFTRATQSDVAAPIANTLQDAVNAMTSARRERVVAASQSLPVELFGLAVIAGLGLVTNALIISNREGRKYALVATFIVLAVALDIGAIVVISGPFRGGLQVSREPISQLSSEIRSGSYVPLPEPR